MEAIASLEAIARNKQKEDRSFAISASLSTRNYYTLLFGSLLSLRSKVGCKNVAIHQHTAGIFSQQTSGRDCAVSRKVVHREVSLCF